MKVQRNVFDLSHDRKLTCFMGKLVPIYLEEVIPGDYFKVNTSMVVRLTPLVAPMMHRVDVFTHYFFVPTRLVWDDFQKFITGGFDGKDTTVWPHKVLGALDDGSIADYFGLPIGTPASSLTVSAIPFRALNLIYNEWYMDQNLQTARVISKASGADTTTAVDLPTRCWEGDYFTLALPWAQRGDSVMLPLGESAPVLGIAKKTGVFGGTNVNGRESDGGSATYASGQAIGDSSGDDAVFYVENNGSNYPNIRADLSQALGASINDFRQAVGIQQFMERSARTGGRYVETVLGAFGVRSSDARLQRPEFLGGGRSPIVVSEVLQTSETSGTSPQGNMAGHAFSLQAGHGFSKSFEEHGYIIGIMSIMPRTAYQQGVARHWSRSTRYDYPWPEFANLGEQAILNKEIYADGDADPTDGDNGVWGYIGRYDELRHRESSVHGLFRKAPGDGGLDFWHMGRIFSTRPTLSSEFVTCDPTDRISAVTGEHNCLVQIMHNVRAARPLPLRGEPGLRRI